MPFSLNMTVDDIPYIERNGQPIARALTRKDGETLVEILNELVTGQRDRLLAEITDAVENFFDGAS